MIIDSDLPKHHRKFDIILLQFNKYVICILNKF